MLVCSASVEGNQASLGYSVFKPGATLSPVAHDCEEFAYVVKGAGHLVLDDGDVAFQEGDALFIPSSTWHAVVNPNEEEVVMVFGFPHPDYPPTGRR